MAAIYLGAPGSDFGPCPEACPHPDCAQIREVAEGPCTGCSEPIGYDRAFFFQDGHIHRTCLIEVLREEGVPA